MKKYFLTIGMTFDYGVVLNLFIHMENSDPCKDVDWCSCHGHMLFIESDLDN